MCVTHDNTTSLLFYIIIFQNIGDMVRDFGDAQKESIDMISCVALLKGAKNRPSCLQRNDAEPMISHKKRKMMPI